MEMQHSANEAVAALYDTYRRPILAHLSRLVGDAETAEDLLQETFIRAMRAMESETPTYAGSWLYRIATNLAYDHLRRRRRIAFIALADDESNGATSSPEGRTVEQDAVAQALAELPERYSTPLVLHNGGHKVEEIAAAFGWPVGTVKARLFRARQMFRSAYAS